MHSKLLGGGGMWTKSGLKDARCESLFFTIHSVATMLVTLFPVLKEIFNQRIKVQQFNLLMLSWSR